MPASAFESFVLSGGRTRLDDGDPWNTGFVQIDEIITFFHIAGVVVGLGAAVVSDYLFVRFVTDGVLDRGELRALRFVSALVVVGLALIVPTGFLYALASPERWHDGKFWAIATVTAVICINGAVIHRKVIPVFEAHVDRPLVDDEFEKTALLVFNTGAVSTVSWWVAVLLGVWVSADFRYPYLYFICAYAVLLLGGIITVKLAGPRVLQVLRAQSATGGGSGSGSVAEVEGGMANPGRPRD
ncbi:hypothetical protein [Streptomyces sp. NPDC006879]|uniref:hypothetical protein n=1 Tax=Streptomyces sp. NPDC006879 TaxID=3364767 RepID=UPI0036803C63